MNLIAGKCSLCENAAVGFNIVGPFCEPHKEVLVRDWTKETPESIEKIFETQATLRWHEIQQKCCKSCVL